MLKLFKFLIILGAILSVIVGAIVFMNFNSLDQSEVKEPVASVVDEFVIEEFPETTEELQQVIEDTLREKIASSDTN